MGTLKVNVDRSRIDDGAFAAFCVGSGKLEHMISLSVWARKNGLSSAGVEPLLEACQNLISLKLNGLTIEIQNNNVNKETKEKFEQLKCHSAGKAHWNLKW